MHIQCYFEYQSFLSNNKNLDKKTVIVLDVLRATTTMITALSNGAKEIISVREIDDARKLKENNPTAILSGERNGVIIDGFELGNSPFEFSEKIVSEKSIIACTTNGTSAIAAANNAKEIWIGALINAHAISDKVLHETKETIIILCSGTLRQPSLDDILGAGAIIYYLSVSQNDELIMNDGATIALNLYDYYRKDLKKGLLTSNHGKKLYRAGLKDDINFCCQDSITDIVPVMINNKITIY